MAKSNSDHCERADIDPRIGDTIKLRNVRPHQRNVAREIVGIDHTGGRVVTTGKSGRQRNSMMTFARLAAYDRVGRLVAHDETQAESDSGRCACGHFWAHHVNDANGCMFCNCAAFREEQHD